MDIAEYVHTDLNIMDKDSKMMRGDKPYIFTDMFSGTGLDQVVQWIKTELLFEECKNG